MTQADRIAFRVFGIPQTKGSSRAFPYFNRAKQKWAAATTNDNPKNKSWALLVREVAHSNALTGMPWRDAVELRLYFRMKKPAHLPKERNGYPITKPDLDKMERSIKDALTGVVYLDDAQVCNCRKFKRYDDRPGVDVVAINLVLAGRVATENVEIE